jgi:hypothetical protein
MTRAVLALFVVTATSTAASAGTYFGLGVGSAADMVSNTSGITMKGNDRSLRGIVGYRFGRLSVEGAVSHYGMFLNALPFDSNMASASLKYSLPLGSGFGVFGSAGLQHTWLSTSSQGGFSADGTGYVLGLGAEYRLNVSLLGGASIFVDYQRAETSFTNSSNAKTNYDGQAGLFTLGLTVSL